MEKHRAGLKNPLILVPGLVHRNVSQKHQKSMTACNANASKKASEIHE